VRRKSQSPESLWWRGRPIEVYRGYRRHWGLHIMEDHWCSSKWSHGCDWGWRRAHEGWRNCHGRRRGWCPSHVWAHAHWRRAAVEGLVSPSSPGSSGGCTITIAPPRAAIVVVPLSTPPPGSGGSISGVVPATCGAIRRRVVPGGGTAPGRLVATVMGPRGVLVRRIG